MAFFLLNLKIMNFFIPFCTIMLLFQELFIKKHIKKNRTIDKLSIVMLILTLILFIPYLSNLLYNLNMYKNIWFSLLYLVWCLTGTIYSIKIHNEIIK